MIKIAVIEDDFETFNIIVNILESKNFVVQGSQNGYDGIDLVKRFEPDVVLCDIMMPHVDGFDVLKELKKSINTASIPFIFITAKTDRESIRHGMELGADDFITKPFNPTELLASVNTRIIKYRSTEEIHQTTLRLLKKNISYALPHELKTPLGTVLGYSELIREQNGQMDTETLLECVDNIISGGHRLQRVIENYLVYAQLELITDPKDIGYLRNNIVPDVAPIISSTAWKIAANYSRKDDLELEVEALALRIANNDLRKIIYELVDNAFKFSEKGSSVGLKAERQGSEYTIYIYDQGRGIAQEHLELMDGYMQFDRTLHEQQGLGLGFSIAQKLIHFHGGDLAIQSEVNTGTILKIRFPMY